MLPFSSSRVDDCCGGGVVRRRSDAVRANVVNAAAVAAPAVVRASGISCSSSSLSSEKLGRHEDEKRAVRGEHEQLAQRVQGQLELAFPRAGKKERDGDVRPRTVQWSDEEWTRMMLHRAMKNKQAVVRQGAEARKARSRRAEGGCKHITRKGARVAAIQPGTETFGENHTRSSASS